MNHYQIGGDVHIHPSAAIAPDVFLLADAGCQVTVAAGVSIGHGCVIHACGGDIVVEVAATLGTAVLLVGSGKIGAHACIGSMSTLYNPHAEAQQVIPPHALLMGSEIESAIAQSSVAGDRGLSPQVPDDTDNPWLEESSHPELPSSFNSGTANQLVKSPTDSKSSASIETKVVYGKAEFYRLMEMLFPHREALMQQLTTTELAATDTATPFTPSAKQPPHGLPHDTSPGPQEQP
ncbi:hypothetical protein ACQ4M4_22735 [Leptolyngbya sp. AN02str]|uniref:hypothetical protein n=1 Tax=Leptolyngbya sp. AN02str TaxID=3423363 RepID=UPI003D31CD5C